MVKTSEVARAFRERTPKHQIKELEYYLKYGGRPIGVDVFDEVLFHAFERLQPEFRRFLYSYRRMRTVSASAPPPQASIATGTAAGSSLTSSVTAPPPAVMGVEYRRSILMEYIPDIAVDALHINVIAMQRICRAFLARRRVQKLIYEKESKWTYRG